MTAILQSRQRAGAALVAATGAVALAAAFMFQYGLHLAPCELCIAQRWPHGVAIVLGLAALAARGRVRSVLVALGGIALLTTAAIAAYHVGVEHHWWAGPEACTSSLGANLSLDALKAQLLATPVVRCDTIVWSLFGITMAGYNFLLSTAAGLAALVLALTGRAA